MSDNIQEKGLVSQEKLRQGILEFERYMSNGEVHEVLTIIGDATKITKGVKLVVDIRSWYVAHKIKAFVETLNSQNIDAEKYQELSQKYGQDKVLKEILVRLDRFSNEVHAKVFAHFVAALMAKQLTWQRFATLGFCLELLNPQDIEEYEDEQHLGTSFITASLAYITYTYDGAVQSITPNGARFVDFYDFGLKPFLESTVGEREE